jgi:hypothetical protein
MDVMHVKEEALQSSVDHEGRKRGKRSITGA